MSKKIYYIILSIAAFIIPELCVYFPLNTELITLEKSVFIIAFVIYFVLAVGYIIFGAKKVTGWRKRDILWSVLIVIVGIILLVPTFLVLLYLNENVWNAADILIS